MGKRLRALRALSVQRPIRLAGSVVGALRFQASESMPTGGAVDGLFGNVVHVDGNSQDRGERDQIGADMTVADCTVISAPMSHDRVYVSERAVPGRSWDKPGCGPSRACSLIERIVNVLGQANRAAFCNLHDGPNAFH